LRKDFNPSSAFGVPKAARVLVVTDTHLRDTDFKSIGNYVNVTNRVWMDIIEFCQENNVTHLFHTGDMFDKGYRAIDRAHNDSNLARRASEVVLGNFYKTIGNHFFIERDNNPAMYLIQPHEKYIPKKKIFAEIPVIKVVKDVMVEGVQFSFLHFDKEDKNYINRRHPDATYHIGIFHDDTMVPSSVRKRLGMRSEVSSDYIRLLLSNIDEAIVGHIHIPIGTTNLQVDGRTVTMDIPGSLCICNVGEIHTDVELPMYDIVDGKITKQFVPFTLHADKLQFFEKKESDLPAGVIAPPDMRHPTDVMKTNLGTFLGVEEFLRQEGCRNDVLDVVHKAAKGELDFKAAVTIFLKRDQINAPVEELVV
jgi:DNA repair exonuclease SbcCD nuclease subunit